MLKSPFNYLITLVESSKGYREETKMYYANRDRAYCDFNNIKSRHWDANVRGGAVEGTFKNAHYKTIDKITLKD